MFTNRNLVESLQNGLSFKKNYFNWRKIEISKLTEKENVLLHSMQVDKTLKVEKLNHPTKKFRICKRTISAKIPSHWKISKRNSKTNLDFFFVGFNIAFSKKAIVLPGIY